MNNRLLWLLSLLLAGPRLARAQEVPSSYQAEYDSLTQRAARVRAFVDGRITRSHSSFAALYGISRRTKSLAPIRPVANGSLAAAKPSAYRVVKKQITKHKTHGADVTKVFYYAISGKLLLAELYQQHQLVRVQLDQYAERNGRAFNHPYRAVEWVRGDYLRVTIRSAADEGSAPQKYYFTAPGPN